MAKQPLTPDYAEPFHILRKVFLRKVFLRVGTKLDWTITLHGKESSGSAASAEPCRRETRAAGMEPQR